MKKSLIASICTLLVLITGLIATKLFAAEKSFQTHEYAMIRWAGKDNTHVIRPSGEVEFLGPLLAKVSRPDRADERALLLTIAMNAVAKEGYEFAGMTPDAIVMRRPTAR